jgi:hypothetical protein
LPAHTATRHAASVFFRHFRWAPFSSPFHYELRFDYCWYFFITSFLRYFIDIFFISDIIFAISIIFIAFHLRLFRPLAIIDYFIISPCQLFDAITPLITQIILAIIDAISIISFFDFDIFD